MSLVEYTCKDNIATITLNRPDAMNAFNPDMYLAFNAATNRFKNDNNAWVAVITSSSEKAFSAGVDVKALDAAMSTTTDIKALEAIYTIDLEEEYFCDKPIIAAINGYCVGEGLSLVLGADIRICGKNASFCLPEAKVGLPTLNAAIHGTRLIGSAYMLELLLTGEHKDANWAAKTGLVNCMVNDDDVYDTALAWAEKIAALSPLAIQATKSAAVKSHFMSFADICAEMAIKRKTILNSKDAIEGRQAFIEKRKPKFIGE
ncbi:enoyl-CoA hydratase-related protein [Thalassotalea sp. G2M2-11]|uniref:enoyl-CoA hydratase/isomerase family protein n=1 Tax=Thalassotalea sp. G2M2-11 TaxID=2787627 RepID=UPI0019CFF45D|nr:enoyl-CoA hydratase-related protein [Thalassotalea sp. G2M2-11]